MQRLLKEMVVVGLGILSVLYLLAPSLLPDVLPIIGAVDEITATIILTNVLAYYGINLGAFLKPNAQARDATQND